MGELGELLEALHNSRHSYRTLKGEYRLWRREELAREAWEAEARDAGSTVVMSSVSSEEMPSESEDTWRVWVQRPDRVRSEFASGAFGAPISLAVGNRWWTYDEYSGAETNAGDDEVHFDAVGQYSALFEPATIAGLLEFETIGRGQRIGREVVRARATRAATRADAYVWDIVGLVAGENELEVDAERGVLLRVEARHRGEPFLVAEAQSVLFDETFPEDTFEFQPPEGEEVRPVPTEPLMFNLSIDEAVRRASFPVFVPARVPSDWELVVTYCEPRDRPPVPPTVGLGYHSADGTASISLSEFPAGAHEDDEVSDKAPPMQRIQRDGHMMEVRGRTDEWPQSTLRIIRDDTEIWMSSMNLSGDTLVELATKLVPARSGPPQI